MAFSFFEKDMAELNSEYNALISKAKNKNRRNGYKPSEEEYNYYMSAADVANKISNLNIQQRAVHKQWKERAEACEKSAAAILKVLAPENLTNNTSNSVADGVNTSNSVPMRNAVVSTTNSDNTQNIVRTESSFVTKNACEDVTAETIEKWYKDKPDHGFDDIVGMDELKDIIKKEILDNIGWERTDEILNIKPLKSYLFYGPFGTGKTYIIEAVAKELMDIGYKFIQLVGADIHASYVGVGEKAIKIAFQEAVDNAPCILFFDEFENVCPDRNNPNTEGHEKRLSVAFIEAYNLLVSAKKPILLFGATNYPNNVDGAMLSRITPIAVPLPPAEVRTQYFEKKFKNIQLGDDFSFEDMGDMTDNYSFRDLTKLNDKLMGTIKEMGIDSYSVYDENDKKLNNESDINVSEAIKSGKVVLTKDLFDSVKESLPPEKKSDILASIEAFENKN